MADCTEFCRKMKKNTIQLGPQVKSLNKNLAAVDLPSMYSEIDFVLFYCYNPFINHRLFPSVIAINP